MNRRNFLKKSAITSAGAVILPRYVLGGSGYQAPSDTLNIAAIGAGGRGASVMSQLTSENIVAICDVDFNRVEGAFYNNQGEFNESRRPLKEAYDNAVRYYDFREMLEKQADIDAVVIATPDHTHAPAAAMAMRMGKHVYVEKPLTWSVHEARVLRDLAEETGVATQMGNQGHSGDGGREMVELVWDGALGEVHESHIWTNRPLWPQGVPRPDNPDKLPDYVNWDLFLGPAPYRPFSSAYHPWNWRGWTDWGTGALGDMGAHLIDHAKWSLNLGAPYSIEASGSPFGSDYASYPLSTLIHYEFKLDSGNTHKMTWYDGGLLPARPDVVPADVAINPGGGGMLIGEKGVMMYDTYGNNPRMYPQSLEEENQNPPQRLDRIEVSHGMNWVNACKGLNEPSCPFDYAGPLTELMLLGVVALRTEYGKKFFWDDDTGQFSNSSEADQFLHREYRRGWEL
jgi:predicted dehydrogenase